MHVTQKQRQLVEELQKPEQTIKESMMNAGYTEFSASRGFAGVPSIVMKLLGRKGVKLVELGASLNSNQQENLVRGRLAYNVIQGTDKGAQSAKLLGSDRRVNMFTPDTQIGVIALVAPAEVHENMDKMLAELDKEKK